MHIPGLYRQHFYEMSYIKSMNLYTSLTMSHNSLLSFKSLFIKNIHRQVHHSCKILVVGGGTGGCTMAAKFARKFKGSSDQIIIVEPEEVHYYQPLFTLIGVGMGSYNYSKKPMKNVLPRNAKWIKDSVIGFDPENNQIITNNGDTVQYDILIIALGLQTNWDQLPGLVDGLKNAESQVCSIYGFNTVPHVFDKIKKTKDGTAIFTFPNTPVKCPGAPQKIAYLAEDYFRKTNVRNNIEVIYNTSLPVIFGVKKYADVLWKVCNERNIIVNTSTNLVKIDVSKREATFEKLDNSGETCTMTYSLLHVCPPMGPPDVLKCHPQLTDKNGFLCVDSGTLKHVKYCNIFGIGDCLNTPNSKTMAAVAAQAKVLYKNIIDDLAGKPMTMMYTGYSSCPLVTGQGKCIMAEFDYKLQPMETFPIDQSKELYLMFLLKKYFFPFIYWNLMLKGLWNGPEFFRKFTSFMKPKTT
ncbi:sulfide:quinone oxidoreductase, mitochondrial isoform X2 [Vespa velutina]|uniref:sulfide:quinone oxidoreductase, mitochondrial isoform X2 n=1 Tax=Vespa velutina TaxID=202808 RepID=UPI001FB29257|nr:sulfide:quinone oxidoreductase, mitochondrial isoform X2 [Vespa velutina]